MPSDYHIENIFVGHSYKLNMNIEHTGNKILKGKSEVFISKQKFSRLGWRGLSSEDKGKTGKSRLIGWSALWQNCVLVFRAAASSDRSTVYHGEQWL